MAYSTRAEDLPKWHFPDGYIPWKKHSILGMGEEQNRELSTLGDILLDLDYSHYKAIDELREDIERLLKQKVMEIESVRKVAKYEDWIKMYSLRLEVIAILMAEEKPEGIRKLTLPENGLIGRGKRFDIQRAIVGQSIGESGIFGRLYLNKKDGGGQCAIDVEELDSLIEYLNTTLIVRNPDAVSHMLPDEPDKIREMFNLIREGGFIHSETKDGRINLTRDKVFEAEASKLQGMDYFEFYRYIIFNVRMPSNPTDGCQEYLYSDPLSLENFHTEQPIRVTSSAGCHHVADGIDAVLHLTQTVGQTGDPKSVRNKGGLKVIK